MRATATFEDDDRYIEFEADLEDHEEGSQAVNIVATSIEIDGEVLEFNELSAEKRAEILTLADDLEFTPIDSSDEDDIED